ncbi:MAG: ABC transporter ATP-binding protein [Bacteroidetes bacterium]|nr:ABC transporter ATP-binding protein [Bacteroidota bacterium]
MSIRIILKNVGKTYSRKIVFHDISCELHVPTSLAITGRNGVGKTTLLKIIAGILSPTSGSIGYWIYGKPSTIPMFMRTVGYVAPYLELYNEFTIQENLRILSCIRTGSYNRWYANELLERFGLRGCENEMVGSLSTGMKQRVKFVIALLHHPCVLLIDEPSANLDQEGILIVQQCIVEFQKNGIVVLATTVPNEILWCRDVLSLEKSNR